MAQDIKKIAEALFEKIRGRFEDVSMGDEKAQATSAPENARFFNFNYVNEAGKKYGNVTVSIIDNDSLKVYYSTNITEKLESDEKTEWFDFLKELRFFARRNMMTFDTRDVSRAITIKDLKQVTKSQPKFTSGDVEGRVTESRMYGTPKHSFENVGSARIRIVHTESVNPDKRGDRARHINAIYVENAQGERFKLDTRKLSGARAMARHISEGGNPWDDIGQHINSVLKEMSELGMFVRSMRNRTFEDSVATKMLEAAVNHYGNMHRQLNNLKGGRAYRQFVESFKPQAEQLDEVDINQIKERFVKKTFDDRMTAALPHVYKAYQLQEQYKEDQLDTIYSILEGQAELTLATNEGMDEYMKMLRFGDTAQMVKKILEDIASRAVTMPEVSDFAKHWAKNYDMIAEGDQELNEHKALAVQLATHYIQDLRKIKENRNLRVEADSEFSLVSPDILEEGTAAIPQTSEELQALHDILSKPIPFGMDATTVTSELSHVLADDTLFDMLHSGVEAEGEQSDAVPTVLNYLKDHQPGLYQSLGIKIQEPAQPPAGEPDAEMDEPPAAPPPPPPPENPQGQYGQPQAPGPLSEMRRLAGLR
jgi:hypothetical protein